MNRYRAIVALFAVAVTLVGSTVRADEVLGPMAVGGTARDAENRALAQPKQTKKASKPVVTARATEKKSKKSSSDNQQVFGHVNSFSLFGSTDFAERQELAIKLFKALDESGKNTDATTRGDVEAALATVRKNLLDEGYYLVKFSLLRGKEYEMSTGIVNVLVDEGRFGKLTLNFMDDEGQTHEDGVWFSKEQMAERFKSIKEGETFDYSRFRSILFDVNSNPDLIVDTTIDISTPLEGEGKNRRVAQYANLDLLVHESCPFHALLEFNNYGMDEVNEWQTALTLQYLNLTKHDDSLTISPSMSLGAELMSIAASYMLPHHWWLGGNTTLYGGWSFLEVDDVVPQLGLEGTGYFVGLQHSEVLFESDAHLWAASLGLLWRYISDQYSAYNISLNERQVSILPLSLAISYTGKQADALGGRNFMTFQGLYNFMTMGDDVSDLWTDAEENYWVIRGQMARLQPIFGWYDEASSRDLHQWMLFLKLEGQYTDSVLMPVEKLSLGGYNAMRGYKTRGYLGDYGVYGTLELRTPIMIDSISSIFSDRTNKLPIDRLQFLAFCDYGYTAFNDLPTGYDDNTFLYSAGIGARFALTKYFQIKVDYAFPIKKTDWADDDDSELYLSAQLQF